MSRLDAGINRPGQQSTRTRNLKRKPVPEFVPSPVKPQPPPSFTGPFRTLSQRRRAPLPPPPGQVNRQEQHPMPSNWREARDGALTREQHVERPPSPTPDTRSEMVEVPEPRTMTPAKPDLNERIQNELRIGSTERMARYSYERTEHEDQHQSDAASTVAASILSGSTTFEPSEIQPQANTSINSTKRGLPQTYRPPTPPTKTPAENRANRSVTVHDWQFYKPEGSPSSRAVDPDESPAPRRRNIASVPMSASSSANISTGPTFVSSRDDLRSMRYPYRTPETHGRRSLSRELSTSHSQLETVVMYPSCIDNSELGCTCKGAASWIRLIIHILRKILGLEPSPAKY